MNTVIWLNVPTQDVVPFWDRKGNAIVGLSQKAVDLVDAYYKEKGIYDMIAGAIRHIESKNVSGKIVKRIYMVDTVKYIALDIAMRTKAEETGTELGLKDVCQIIPDEYSIPFPEETSLPDVSNFRIIDIDGEIYKLGIAEGYLYALTKLVKARSAGTTLRVSGLGDIAAQDYMHKDFSLKLFPSSLDDLEEIQ